LYRIIDTEDVPIFFRAYSQFLVTSAAPKKEMRTIVKVGIRGGVASFIHETKHIHIISILSDWHCCISYDQDWERKEVGASKQLDVYCYSPIFR